MRRRSRFMFSAAVLVVCLVLLGGSLWLWVWMQEGKIARVNYLRIRPGMSETQVNGLLGQAGKPVERADFPEDDPRHEFQVYPLGESVVSFGPACREPTELEREKFWYKDPETYVVVFDSQGTVQFTVNLSRDTRTVYQRLVQWFR
jgi:hypothetical protein